MSRNGDLADGAGHGYSKVCASDFYITFRINADISHAYSSQNLMNY